MEKNSKQVAFICPIYDMKNHFELGYNLLKSKVELDIMEDMFFVFSNEEQKNKFETLTMSLGHINSLVLPDNLQSYKSKIVIKKMYALESLMNEYDYLVLVDCESIFVKNGDFYNLCQYIWNNRTFLNANKLVGRWRQILCFFELGVLTNSKMLKEFRCYHYGIWFNEIQVYKCDLLPDFFHWLYQQNNQRWRDEWSCFEMEMFAAYLIIEKGYHLNRFPQYKAPCGVIEVLPTLDNSTQLDIISTMNTHWSSSQIAVNDDTYMLFHLDREDRSDKRLRWKLSKDFDNSKRRKFFRNLVKRLLNR